MPIQSVAALAVLDAAKAEIKSHLSHAGIDTMDSEVYSSNLLARAHPLDAVVPALLSAGLKFEQVNAEAAVAKTDRYTVTVSNQGQGSIISLRIC